MRELTHAPNLKSEFPCTFRLMSLNVRFKIPPCVPSHVAKPLPLLLQPSSISFLPRFCQSWHPRARSPPSTTPPGAPLVRDVVAAAAPASETTNTRLDRHKWLRDQFVVVCALLPGLNRGCTF